MATLVAHMAETPLEHRPQVQAPGRGSFSPVATFKLGSQQKACTTSSEN